MSDDRNDAPLTDAEREYRMALVEETTEAYVAEKKSRGWSEVEWIPFLLGYLAAHYRHFSVLTPRAAIAKLIDPQAFNGFEEKVPDAGERKQRVKDAALAKADRILALQPSPVMKDGQHSTVEMRQLENAARDLDREAWRSSDDEGEAAQLRYRRFAARRQAADSLTPISSLNY